MSGFGRILSSLGFLVRETGQALDRFGCKLQGNSAYLEQLSRHRPLLPFTDHLPRVSPDAFVAPSASVIGEVSVGSKSSIWYNAVVRGDVNSIKIGAETNIQDGAVVHVAKTNISGNVLPTIIGNRVTVGHNALLHACVVEDDVIIGMGSVLLDGAKVEKGAMVAAGALVTPGTTVPSGELWGGSPARFMRALSEEEKKFLPQSAKSYAGLAAVHAKENGKSFEQILSDTQMREEWKSQSDDYDSHLGFVREEERPTPEHVKVELR